jgi:hypothetical protein
MIMTNRTMTRPVIPPPPNPHKLFEGTTHVIQGMKIDDAYVVLFYDELVARFSIARNARYVNSLRLSEAMKSDGIVGHVVLEFPVSCGGVIADQYVEAPGTPQDFDLVRQAIPYFYPSFFEPQSKKVMRAVYRRVAKLCTPAVAQVGG